MNDKLHAIWYLLTAPFPLFCIVLMAAVITGVAISERRELRRQDHAYEAAQRTRQNSPDGI